MKKKLSSICLIIMCSFVLQACKSDEYVSDTHKRDDVDCKTVCMTAVKRITELSVWRPQMKQWHGKLLKT